MYLIYSCISCQLDFFLEGSKCCCKRKQGVKIKDNIDTNVNHGKEYYFIEKTKKKLFIFLYLCMTFFNIHETASVV